MKPETIDKAASYAYGSAGVFGGIKLVTWAEAVSISQDFTILFGCMTAIVGFMIMVLRLVRDWKALKNDK